MIFVILGTQKFQLNRLLMQIDACVKDGLIEEEVIAQIGNSCYEPKNFSYFRFLGKSEFDSYIQRARIVITHSGVGSILSALHAKKPTIVFPRLEKYKEHVDNHQLQIAETFAKKRYVLCCKEKDDLVQKIEQCSTFQFQEYISQTENIVEIINNYLNHQFIDNKKRVGK